MAKIQISQLDNRDRVNNLTHKDSSKIHGGDRYIYRHASALDPTIIGMELIYAPGLDTYEDFYPCQ
jgi:hypothetical protein